MAYSYERRKELAAAKLKAAGQRVSGNPERQWRVMSADARQRATTALAARDRSYKGGGVYRPGRSSEAVRERLKGLGGGRVPMRQDVPALGATVTTSASERSIRAALRAAEAAGQRVVLYATMDKGQGPRTRVIDGRGEQGSVISGGQAEGRGAGLGGETDASLRGKVQVVAAPTGSPAFGAGSIDPGDLIDYLDAYDDWLDALADLWDAEYPG